MLETTICPDMLQRNSVNSCSFCMEILPLDSCIYTLAGLHAIPFAPSVICFEALKIKMFDTTLSVIDVVSLIDNVFGKLIFRKHKI